MTTRTRQSRPPLQGLLLGVLLCVWLAAQGLGLAHRTFHAHALASLPQAAVAQLPGPAASDQGGAHARAAPFAGHAHGSDCLLFDHAGAAELLAGLATLVVAAVWAAPVAAPLRAGVSARADAPFQARAPPFLR